MESASASASPRIRLLDRLSDPNAVPGAAIEPRQRSDPDRWLRCARCEGRITVATAAIQVAGSHRHVRSNPHGVSFEFGCFGDAPGAIPHGPPTRAHSWFTGYRWRMAGCGGCGTHLGWLFENTAGSAFFGLVLIGLIGDPGERYERH